MKKIVFIMTCICAIVFETTAEEIKEVVWATPEWEAYVEKDGKGLYNEIIFPAFEYSGIKIKQKYDAGIEHMIQADKLKPIYDKYNEKYPMAE